nr:hypothetical protein [Tanacetum cinerariifolium]
MTELPLVDSGFAIPVFSLGDDLIACLNKAMAFLTAVASLRETMQVDRNGLLNATTIKANISNYGFDVISEVPHSKTYLNDMENQGVHDFEQPPVVDFTDNELHSDSNIIPYS